ncbi:helix-turn-helix domain-containing protein [Streptosporangium sp. NPDC003464]
MGPGRARLHRGPALYAGGVADLIAELFHIRYTPRGVSYLLHRIGWSPQVPCIGRSSATRG